MAPPPRGSGRSTVRGRRQRLVGWLLATAAAHAAVFAALGAAAGAVAGCGAGFAGVTAQAGGSALVDVVGQGHLLDLGQLISPALQCDQVGEVVRGRVTPGVLAG